MVGRCYFDLSVYFAEIPSNPCSYIPYQFQERRLARIHRVLITGTLHPYGVGVSVENTWNSFPDI